MRLTRVFIAALMSSVLLGLVAALPLVRGADATAAQNLQVPLSPSEAAGPQGLAILSPVESGTTVQVLVTGAPEGAIATIHAGTCSEVGPAVVGLIGQLSETGQAQGTIPVPFTTLADGTHLIAVHASFDMASPAACGAIPATDASPTPDAGARSPAVHAQSPAPEPEPDPQPDPTAVAVPTLDPGCAGIPEWLAATRARLEQLATGERELSRLTTDPSAYAAAVREQIGRVNVMIEQMRLESVPSEASAIQQRLLAALESGVTAARDLLQAFATSDPTLYQQAIKTAADASAEVAEVRVAIGELDARCVPAAGG